MPLPPAVQDFTLSAAQFLAGLDEMLERVDALADSLDAAAAAADRLSGVADASSGALDRFTEAEQAADDRTATLVDAIEGLGARLDAIDASIDVTTAAVDEMAAAYDRAAGSAGIAGDSAQGAGDKAATAGAMWKTALLGIAVGLGYGIDQAAKYQSSSTKLLTQAGVAKSQYASLQSGVLSLASSVGFSPNSLMAALYHVESSFQSVGITAPKALSLLQTASEGAQTGGANLVDVTNALDATIAAGVGGITTYSQAMGALNAIVGAGDMTMEDLAQAMGTGLMAQGKLYGQTIQQIGAALATLGDNNIRGAKAATDLRMTWQAIQAPLAGGVAVLNHLGLASSTLADTMVHHGLTAAIGQFIQHLNASKVPVADWGQYVTEIFGKRAGTGIGVLIDQYGRLVSKLPDIKKGADDFGSAWATQQKTLSQQWDNLKGGLQALAISFGTVLLPMVTKVVGGLAKFATVLEQHPAIAKFAGAMLTLAAGFKIAATMESIFNLATKTDPVFLVLTAVIALAAGLYLLYTHFKSVRDAVADVGAFFKSVWTGAVHVAGAVVQWFVNGPLAFIKQQMAVFSQFWAQHGQQIEQIASAVWGMIQAVISTAWHVIYDGIIRPGLTILKAIWTLTWGVIRDTVKMAWNVIAAVVSTAIHVVLDVIGVVLDLLTGKWGKAWSDLKKLASDALHGAITIIRSIASGFGTLLYDAGKAIVQGLINGVKSMFGAIGKVAGDLGHGIVGGFKSFLHIFSPSQVFYQLGAWIVEGLANGVNATTAQAVDASRKMAQAVYAAALSGQITSSEEAQLQAQLSKALDTAERAIQARAQALVKTMTKISLEMQAGLLSSLEDASSASAAKTAVNKLISYVQQAFTAGDITSSKASAMTTWLEADNTRLQNLAAQRQAIAKEITVAGQYANTTSTNTQQWAGLSNVASSLGTGSVVYSGNLLAGMQANLTSIRQFGVAIKQLAKMGLRKDLLNQIIQMGPAQGLQVAQALVDGPMSVVAQMNTTQAQIVSGSAQLGLTAANAMYDSGTQAGKGFLSGLEAQQKQITAMMDKIAQSMVDTIRKALKISSPSQVMAEHGRMIAAGLQVGMEDGAAGVRGAAKVLAAAALPAGTGTGGAAGTAAASQINVHVTVNVTGFIGNENQLVQEIYDAVQSQALRRAKRNGLNNGFNL